MRSKILKVLLMTLLLTGCSSNISNDLTKYNNAEGQYYSDNKDYGLEENLDELIEYQKEMDKTIDNLIKDKTITLDTMQVIPNPYKLSHLSAIAVFYTEQKESVKVYIEDELVYTLEESNEHSLPIYGLYSDKNNKVTIELGSGTKKDIYIQTEQVYGKDLEVTTSKISNDVFFYSSSSNSDEDVAYDHNGKIRWYMNGYLNKDILILENGHILVSNGVSNGNDVQGVDVASGLIEVDYLGKIYNQYIVPNGIHHELRDLGNDRVVLCSFSDQEYQRNDIVYIVNLKTGKIEKKIDLYEVVKKVSPSYAEEIKTDRDWTHINSIAVDEENNILYVSFRGKNSIMALSLDKQEIEWIFTNTKDQWPNEFHKYIISLNNEDYIVGQHSITIVDGNIGIFNNNCFMDHRNQETYEKFHGYSFPAIYSIKNNKVSVEYKYDSKTKYYSKAHGSFAYYDDNTKLVNYSMNERQDDGSQHKYMIIFILDENDNVMFQGKKENDSTYSLYSTNIYSNVTNFTVEKYNLVNFK